MPKSLPNKFFKPILLELPPQNSLIPLSLQKTDVAKREAHVQAQLDSFGKEYRSRINELYKFFEIEQAKDSNSMQLTAAIIQHFLPGLTPKWKQTRLKKPTKWTLQHSIDLYKDVYDKTKKLKTTGKDQWFVKEVLKKLVNEKESKWNKWGEKNLQNRWKSIVNDVFTDFYFNKKLNISYLQDDSKGCFSALSKALKFSTKKKSRLINKYLDIQRRK